LFWRSKVLIAERRLARALDADKRLAGSGVAAIAALGQCIESGGKLRAALAPDCLLELLDARIDDGLDYPGHGNAVKRRMNPCRVLETFLDLIHLIGGERPIVVLAGKPELGVAKLGRRHELTKTGHVGLLSALGIRWQY